MYRKTKSLKLSPNVPFLGSHWLIPNHGMGKIGSQLHLTHVKEPTAQQRNHKEGDTSTLECHCHVLRTKINSTVSRWWLNQYIPGKFTEWCWTRCLMLLNLCSFFCKTMMCRLWSCVYKVFSQMIFAIFIINQFWGGLEYNTYKNANFCVPFQT